MLYIVDVLLSTYNGEEYLSAQIDSLLCQTYSYWKLIIRDDLSSDATMSLISEYKNKYPDKIFVLDNQSVRRGIIGSFKCLLEASTARYVAFCDQDDVWESNKLQMQISKMRELEVKHGKSTPTLIHTDLSVVGDRLRLINESLWKYQHLSPNKMSTLPRLLVQNCVTGCSVMVNRALIEKAMPFPKGVIMHDWWLALIAVSEGIICDMSMPTVKYRQHDSNDTGAKQWGFGLIFRTIRRGRESLFQNLKKTRVQAEALLAANILCDENNKIVQQYVSMYRRNWLARRIEMIRIGFFKYGVVRNIAMFFLI